MDIEDIFAAVAAEYRLDKHQLAEQGWRESRWDPLAVGQANDMGIMQLVPATWNEWAPKVGVYDPFDPESNVRVAAAYLTHLRVFLAEKLRLRGDHWLLVAYNWGLDNVRRLVEGGQGWEQVPAARQDYALGILLGAETRALAAAEQHIH